MEIGIFRRRVQIVEKKKGAIPRQKGFHNIPFIAPDSNGLRILKCCEFILCRVGVIIPAGDAEDNYNVSCYPIESHIFLIS
jgi:hypothetical protein